MAEEQSRSKSAYNSQARGLRRLQLSFSLSLLNTLPYCEWRSRADGVVGLGFSLIYHMSDIEGRGRQKELAHA